MALQTKGGNKMNLSKEEKMLIEALRDINDAPHNVLLWYSEGLENNKSIIPKLKEMDEERISKAKEHIKRWHSLSYPEDY